MEPKNKERSYIRQAIGFAKKSLRRVNRGATGAIFAFAMVPFVGIMALAAGDSQYNPDRVTHAAVDELEVFETSTSLVTTTTTSTTTTSSTSSTSTSTSTSTTVLESTTTTVTSVAEAEDEIVRLVASESETEASQAEVTESETETYEDAVDEATAAESSDSWTITSVSEQELIMLAKTVAQEAGDCSYTQQACVIWTVLNRVDSSEWPNTVYDNLVKPNQFAYYSWKEYRNDHYQVACDVVAAWENGGERLLGSDYQYFYGDGYRNHFYGKNSSEVCPD